METVASITTVSHVIQLAVAPVFWDSLSEKERRNVERWLGNSINEKK